MAREIDLSKHGIPRKVPRNVPPAVLYEHAIRHELEAISALGALVANSGAKTGRSPKDKRIVKQATTEADVWWGDVNIPLDERWYMLNRQRAVDYLNTCDTLFAVDGFAGWDPKHRLRIRVICSRAYHALFMHNMLIRPTAEELLAFGKPDFVIYNAGRFPADAQMPEMTSTTSINLNFDRGEFVILGTEYAGEMKKGVFTVMNYLMPKRGVLSMHCSANEGRDGDVALFFGLSGTGKTTLSTEPRRRLIGDDEHCWTEDGIFNIEGGCYAKCIRLSPVDEREIFGAIRAGAVLENVVYDQETRVVDFDDDALTENTRAAYPIEFISQAKIPCVGGHPKNVILLACDAFGVLPPVSLLTPAQAMYHFVSGYSAKVAGTEMGVLQPQATFSACFGAAFLVWHPSKYAAMLAEKVRRHDSKVWLVNTGWVGGGPGQGDRIKLQYTRAIIDAIHAGILSQGSMHVDDVFGLQVPAHVPGVPDKVLVPAQSWPDAASYKQAALKLARLFQTNFAKYAGDASAEVRQAGPLVD